MQKISTFIFCKFTFFSRPVLKQDWLNWYSNLFHVVYCSAGNSFKANHHNFCRYWGNLSWFSFIVILQSLCFVAGQTLCKNVLPARRWVKLIHRSIILQHSWILPAYCHDMLLYSSTAAVINPDSWHLQLRVHVIYRITSAKPALFSGDLCYTPEAWDTSW